MPAKPVATNTAEGKLATVTASGFSNVLTGAPVSPNLTIFEQTASGAFYSSDMESSVFYDPQFRTRTMQVTLENNDTAKNAATAAAAAAAAYQAPHYQILNAAFDPFTGQLMVLLRRELANAHNDAGLYVHFPLSPHQSSGALQFFRITKNLDHRRILQFRWAGRDRGVARIIVKDEGVFEIHDCRQIFRYLPNLRTFALGVAFESISAVESAPIVNILDHGAFFKLVFKSGAQMAHKYCIHLPTVVDVPVLKAISNDVKLHLSDDTDAMTPVKRANLQRTDEMYSPIFDFKRESAELHGLDELRPAVFLWQDKKWKDKKQPTAESTNASIVIFERTVPQAQLAAVTSAFALRAPQTKNVKTVVLTGMQTHICGACTRPIWNPLICSACDQIAYCSRECQEKDFRSHDFICDSQRPPV